MKVDSALGCASELQEGQKDAPDFAAWLFGLPRRTASVGTGWYGRSSCATSDADSPLPDGIEPPGR